MLTKETLEMISADLARDHAIGLNSSRYERQCSKGTNLDDVQQHEIEMEEELKVEEQHDESNEINDDDLEHLKIQKKLVAFLAFCGVIYGLDTKYGFAMYRRPLFYLTSFFLIFGFFDLTYTAYDKYQNGGPLEFLEPLGIIGTLVTLSVKWVNCSYLMNNINCLVNYTPKYYIHQNKTGVTADIIKDNLLETMRIVEIYARGVLVVLFFYLIIPMKYFVFDNVYLPILPIYIPFFDCTTLNGFLISNAVQTVFCIYGGTATLMFGSSILISICNYGMLVDLVQHDIKTLDHMHKHPHDTSIAYRHAFLKNICNKLQDMRNYIKLLKETYELNLFIYFFMAYSGQVLCIFSINKNNWVSGYTPATVIFIEMAFYCFIGTKLTTMDNKLTELIYCECDWYIFDLQSQKTFLLLLHASQMRNDLRLGPIGTLNMATGISIVKSIYSYYTFLTEVL